MTIATIRKPQAKFMSIPVDGTLTSTRTLSPLGDTDAKRLVLPLSKITSYRALMGRETPGLRAEIVITSEEFEEWAARVLKAIKEGR